MRKSEFRWAQIRVGLFVAIVGIVLFAAVVYLGLAGSPFARYVELKTQLPDASGLAPGSPVEMGGVVIGEVRRIELPEIATGKVPVTLMVRPDALERIGPSSTAVLASHALVGLRFVGISPRQPDEPMLQEGATLRSVPSRDLDTLIEDATLALLDFRELLEDLRGLSAPLARAGVALDEKRGTLGMLVYDDAVYSQLVEAGEGLTQVLLQATEGDGALAAVLSDKKMAAELRQSTRALAQAAQKMQRGQGLLGRLIYDDTSALRVDRTLANLESVSEQIANTQGTLGSLIGDDALLLRMNGLLDEMDSLVTDVRRNPSRYLKLEAF